MNMTMMVIMTVLAMIAGLVALTLMGRRLFGEGAEKNTRGVGSVDGKCAPRPARYKSIKRHWRKVYLMPLLIHRLTGWWPGAARCRLQVQFANIGQGGYEHGRRPYIPDASTSSRYLMYKRGSDADHCAVCGLNDDPLGPSDDLADANNLDVPISINLLGAAKGTVFVVTDGTVNDGDYCKCGAAGQITKATTGDQSFGRALITTDTTKAAGDVISLIPTLPAKYSF
jgi:hypothetical protein